MKKKPIILQINLSKNEFNLIEAGKIHELFREKKKYWEDRLLDQRGQFKRFSEILIRNRCGEGQPSMRIKWAGAEMKQRSYFEPQNGEDLSGDSHWFRILLGDILEVRRPE